jgi:uncharacterized iron-regulated protein
MNDAQLNQLLRSAKVVLLGEKHDNPRHHEIQLELLEEYARSGDTVVFEQIHEGQQQIISFFMSNENSSSNDLKEQLKWEKSGWPAWDMYRPLFLKARDLELNVKWGLATNENYENLDGSFGRFG